MESGKVLILVIWKLERYRDWLYGTWKGIGIGFMGPGKVLVLVIWKLERHWLYGNWKGIGIVKYVKTIGGGTLDRWQEAGCALIGTPENYTRDYSIETGRVGCRGRGG